MVRQNARQGIAVPALLPLPVKMATFFPCQFTAWYTPMAARYISSLLGTYNAMVWASLSRMVATVMTVFHLLPSPFLLCGYFFYYN